MIKNEENPISGYRDAKVQISKICKKSGKLEKNKKIKKMCINYSIEATKLQSGLKETLSHF